MPTAAFDTYKAIQRLQSAGFNKKSAEAVVSTVQESFDDHVATKSDLLQLESKLETSIANFKLHMILWMIPLFAIAIISTEAP